LTKYFGDGGFSESEDEDEDESMEADDEVDEEDEEFDYEPDEPIPLGRTWTILKPTEPKPPESNGARQANLDDISDTGR
jgi:hypothetical protein